jgi:hypothetical protein
MADHQKVDGRKAFASERHKTIETTDFTIHGGDTTVGLTAAPLLRDANDGAV